MRLRTSLVGLCLGVGLMIAGAATATESAEQLARNVLALDASKQHGAELFRSQCAACHGRSARGDSAKLIPALAGQRRAYLVKQLADFALTERVATAMHSVLAREEASEPQAWADIALYLNGLPVVATPKVGPGKRLVAAKATYQQWCASCHEDDARGDDDGFVPSLRNQHYAYLKHEMSAMAAGHRFALEAELRDFLATLEPDARTSVADYLSRMRGAVRDRASLRDDGSLSD